MRHDTLSSINHHFWPRALCLVGSSVPTLECKKSASICCARVHWPMKILRNWCHQTWLGNLLQTGGLIMFHHI
jgi:hypothetical protein